MVATIDIGTNTVLLLIAEYDGNKMQVIQEEQRIPRLGKGVDENRNLSEDAIGRVIAALTEFRHEIDQNYSGISDTLVMATSAVRDANNREDFVDRVKKETGFTVRILSGDEEAEWTYLGALSMLNFPTSRQYLTLDIGGGSSEISLGRGNELIDFYSFNVGSVRFTERFIYSDPPEQKEIQTCRKAIEDAFSGHRFSWKGDAEAVGIAGTVTSLAYMEADMVTYDPQKLAGMTINHRQVDKWVKHIIASMSTAELIEAHPVVMEGRGDVFLAGVLILQVFLEQYGFEEITVSTGGIRHGAVLKHRKMFPAKE